MIQALSEIKIYAYGAPYTPSVGHKFIVPVTDKCERSAQVMGDDYVKLSFNSATKLTLNAFDYIYYDEQFFFLKEDYTPKNVGSNGTTAAYYTYDVKFWSVANMLEKFAFIRHFQVLPQGATTPITCDEPEVELNGNLEVFGQLVGESLEYLYTRIDSRYVQFRSIIQQLCTRDALGAFSNIVVKSDTDMVTVSFNGNFADFLTTITQQYTEPDKKVEWYITKDNVLHIDKCQNESLLTLDDSVTMIGGENRTGGLTSVEYAQEQNPLPQYIIPYGSDRNIESQMGQQESINLAVSFGKRLRLDPNTTYTIEGIGEVTTDSACRIQIKNAQGSPLVNTGIELIKFYDDVYPQGHFCVDEVKETFKTIDGVKQPRYEIKGYAVTNDYRGAEDYNAQHTGTKFIPKNDTRLQGIFPIDIVNTETLSINFESGFLNGREFEVANKTTKDTNAQGQIVNTYSVAFSIIADGDIKEGTLLPSGNCIPHVGDKFAIFNMVMPQYYIEEAKKELAKACYKELQELYNTKPEIKCKTDEKEFGNYFVELGTQVLVTSLNLNVAVDGTRSEKSRVIAFSHSLTKPNKVDFTLSSAISEGRLTGLETMIAEQGVQLSGTQQRAINLSKRGWRDQSEMADMLDSLRTEMMLVGEEKYQFGYTFGIQCSQDMEGHSADTQTQFLHFTAGQLAHTQEPYIGYSNKGVWYLSEQNVRRVGTDEGDLITAHPDTAYYVYAVCADNEVNAHIELYDSRQDGVEYMQLGVLSSEFEDNGTHFRVFNRTNGYTSIAGGTLTTEQIQDYNRNLIIDFQSNPPRIIARNGAEIYGNIRFMAFDENGNFVNALAGDTRINGGTILSEVMKLKDANGIVTAGMSGRRTDNIGLWFGGDYEAAKQAAAGIIKLPVFISPQGLGSNIGCFNVVDKDTVNVQTEQNEVVITTKSISDITDTFVTKDFNQVYYTNLPSPPVMQEGEEATLNNISAYSTTYSLPKGKYSLTDFGTSLHCDLTAQGGSLGSIGNSYASFTINSILLEVLKGSEVLASGNILSNTATNSVNSSSTEIRTNSTNLSIRYATFNFELQERATITIRITINGGIRGRDGNLYSFSQSRTNSAGVSEVDFNGNITAQLVSTNKYVIIAKDGAAFVRSSSSKFVIKNTDSSNLTIIASGLPETASEEGQICLGEQIGDYKTLFIRHTPS